MKDIVTKKSHIRADSQVKQSAVTTDEASSFVTEHSDCVDATTMIYKVLLGIDFVQCNVVWTTQRASSKRAASYEEASILAPHTHQVIMASPALQVSWTGRRKSENL